MNRQQPTTGSNCSDHLRCPHCNTQLPSHAVFCSFCGEQVKKNGENDTQTQLEVPPQSELLPSLPATPTPSILEEWQQVPETEVPALLSEGLTAPATPVPGVDTKKHPFPQHGRRRVTIPLPADSSIPQPKVASNLSRADWLWPTIIMFSALAAGLVNFVFTDIAIRPVVVFWFLFVCPGMVLVRFLRLKEPVVEWTLAIVLSFAIEAIVAGIQLSAGKWSPAGILSILIGLSLGGAIVQLAIIYLIAPLPVTQLLWSVVVSLRNKVFRLVGVVLKLYLVNPLYKGFSKIVSNGKTTPSLPKLPRTILTRNRRVLVPILLTLLVVIIVGASLWSYEVYHNPGSATSSPALSHKPPPHANPTLTVVPTPSSTFPANIAGLYQGTIYDISANVTTRMSLMGIQQTQASISGDFSGLHRTGTFNGIINLSKHIQFTVKDSAGRLILSFEGDMQSSGDLSGNYCSVNQDAQCTGEYGLWSVAPAS